MDECGIYGTERPFIPLDFGNVEQSSHQNYSVRFETYANWPVGHPIKPKDLSEAGFYYQGWKLD